MLILDVSSHNNPDTSIHDNFNTNYKHSNTGLNDYLPESEPEAASNIKPILKPTSNLREPKSQFYSAQPEPKPEPEPELVPVIEPETYPTTYINADSGELYNTEPVSKLEAETAAAEPSVEPSYEHLTEIASESYARSLPESDFSTIASQPEPNSELGEGSYVPTDLNSKVFPDVASNIRYKRSILNNNGSENFPTSWTAENYPPSSQYTPRKDFHAMDCTDIVIGVARGDYGRVLDYYTRDRSTPKVDSFFGGKDDLTAALAVEKDDLTTIIFRKKLLGNS